MSLPRLRIAFIAYKFGHQYGGAEAYGVELMRELSKRHDITVIARAYDLKNDLSLPFIPIILSDRWPSWFRSYLFAKSTDRIIKAGNYDLVHSHMNGWNGDLDILHVKSVRYHSLIKKRSWWKKITNVISPRIQMYLWLEKQRIHITPPRRTAVVSEALKQQLQQAYQNHSFDIIPPGVHLPALDNTLRTRSRKQLKFNDEDTVGILVARNPLNKGLSSILAALPKLPETFKLLVVGGPDALEKQLHSQLKQSNLFNRVVFIGQTSDMSSYYQAADIGLHPTFNDSFGMAPLEAMAYGLPVIMSDARWCGFTQYATHGKNALLLKDPHDATELSAAISKLINNTTLKQQVKQQGHVLARNFSWDKIAKQVESIYIDIIATRLHQK